jgi:hypothetical protein
LESGIKISLWKLHYLAEIGIQNHSRYLHPIVDEVVDLTLVHAAEELWTFGLDQDERDPTTTVD